MPRTERLLALMQQLRTSHQPQQARALAQALGVSLRTLYRDIDTLRAQGADIRGEAGVGYVLRKGGPTLPPLMFDATEIEALVLGLRWVTRQPDPDLASSAHAVLAKVGAVLPARLQPLMAGQALYPVTGREVAASVFPDARTPPVGQTTPAPPGAREHGANDARASSHPGAGTPKRPPVVSTGKSRERALLPTIRQALRENRQLRIDYTDAQGQGTQRLLWPVALGYFEDTRLLAAWCTLREDFRHFRADRIQRIWLDDACPVPRRKLERDWLRHTGISLAGYHDRN